MHGGECGKTGLCYVASEAEKWSAYDDEALRRAIGSVSTDTNSSSWSEISRHVPGKTSEQCYVRWTHYLRSDFLPMQTKAPGIEESAIIHYFHMMHGMDWALIQEKLNAYFQTLGNQALWIQEMRQCNHGYIPYRSQADIRQWIMNSKYFVKESNVWCAKLPSQKTVAQDADNTKKRKLSSTDDLSFANNAEPNTKRARSFSELYDEFSRDFHQEMLRSQFDIKSTAFLSSEPIPASYDVFMSYSFKENGIS